MLRLNNCFIYDVPNHLTHKKHIIDLIDKIPPNKYGGVLTDYNLPNTFPREYQNYFMSQVYPGFKFKFLDAIKMPFLDLTNLWFQIYNQNDFHDWHVHGNCHYTNVYFLELPNQEFKTEVKYADEKILLDLTEGKILSMPSFYLHRSPINLSSKHKVIISFNTSVRYF